MKKYTLFIVILFGLLHKLQSQSSVLSNGTWYKFAISNTGVFKIDANFLQSLGVNTSAINPATIKIYGNGGALLPELVADFRYDSLQENAIYVKGEEDGVFNNDDYILFYGIGPHTWEVDATINSANHIQNIYSDKAYYFLTIADSAGKRIQQRPVVSGTPTITVTNFNDYAFYEKEEVNMFALGKLWFGESFSIENEQEFSIPFKNHTPNSTASVKVSVAVQSTLATTMNVVANNQQVSTVTISGSTGIIERRGDLAKRNDATGTITLNNDTVDITLTYNNNGQPAAKSYLDYIEVLGEKELTVTDEQITFRSFNAINTEGIAAYQIQNATDIYGVWDVTDPINISSISNTNVDGTSFDFLDNAGVFKEYVALHEDDFYTPEKLSVSGVENQDLHSLSDIEYLVITSEDLVAQAQRLADHHQTNSNLTTKVVSLPQIYNEFASGSPDITGIRDFIKHLYDKSTVNPLQYVCFLGDSSYDFKDRISGNNNVVPAFHAEQSFDYIYSYVTDDYFVMVDEEDGDMSGSDTIDIATGRIPVTGETQAEKVIDKILNYYSTNTFGDWRSKIVLIADDIDDARSDWQLQSDLEKIADSITKNKPNFNITKIYADAYNQENTAGGERYPEVNKAIEDAMDKGALVFDYFGHGGEDALGEERFIDVTQIAAYDNSNTLPLFITVTCEFSRFDNPLRYTAGEEMFVNENGGAASMITTTRAVFIDFGDSFNMNLARYIFDYNNADESIAKGLINAKNDTTFEQRYFIYFFGDPAMKLAIPKPTVSLTKMNGVDVSQSLDTIKGLSKISLEGIVADENNNVLSDFNGTISTTIYDKVIEAETLNNDNAVSPDANAEPIINTFDIQDSKIFKGKATVTNGVFQLEFVVPKDIRTAYGTGKVSMYAENTIIDKGGANFDIVVGGIDENAPEDTTGPEIFAYMNDASFIEGGETNQSPNLILKLSDISGINTSITAVDHDIVAILDDNQTAPIVLNDYYETALDDYTNGEVNYQFKDLEVGEHTLKIKVWDTYNNSSEVTLSFVVVSDLGLNLTDVLNYPNPFVSYTEFWFTHNKPNQPLEVQVQVFTVSGKLIKTINELVQTTGSLSRSIVWNGLDDFGNRIAKGVYVYKLKVSSNSDNLTAEKYEKLVKL